MKGRPVDAISISRSLLDEMTGHCVKANPEEACGILAGKDGEVKKVYSMANAEKSQVVYQMDSREQFRIMKEMQGQGLDMVAIYHSHPASPAYPSATDVGLAFYEYPAYVIVSLAGEKPDVRAYTIRNSEIKEIGYVIT